MLAGFPRVYRELDGRPDVSVDQTLTDSSEPMSEAFSPMPFVTIGTSTEVSV